VKILGVVPEKDMNHVYMKNVDVHTVKIKYTWWIFFLLRLVQFHKGKVVCA
jgi:DMSO reductase anchor subunit